MYILTLVTLNVGCLFLGLSCYKTSILYNYILDLLDLFLGFGLIESWIAITGLIYNVLLFSYNKAYFLNFCISQFTTLY